MAHYPLDHHLRQPYRLLAAASGLYMTVAGLLGVAASWGESFFGHGSDWALGLRFNPAGAWLSTLAGLAVLAAAALGGNVHHRVSMVLGWALMAVAMVVLAAIQTDANFLNVSMVNVIVLALLGLFVLTAGLYGQVRTAGNRG
ncbi:hypothetical protein GCM10010435_18850 [Winogradskya consettensis]|uniref:DUF4383 domain-containing protein n=1 Tax=Winogradskya consettensis TaxID=113560 RepID=A0A919SUU1_9ACTN|nr:DUF4383 domain-containing protein [Actinoplanes consettensis]GIM78389.1 hypothetical protein Aco04nite_60200 [Actinoplanes consettensis]